MVRLVRNLPPQMGTNVLNDLPESSRAAQAIWDSMMAGEGVDIQENSPDEAPGS